MRRRLTACVVGCFLLSASPSGRQQAPPTFKSGVSIVTIDVTVLDKDGRPVPGLTAADFEVKLNGTVQPVRAAAFVQAATGPAPTAAAQISVSEPPAFTRSGRTVTNVVPRPAAVPPPPVADTPGEPRVFIILVDDLSFPATRGKTLFAAARRFLDRLPASDLIGVTTTSGAAGTVNPTADRGAVRAALEKVVGEFNDPRFLRSNRSAPSGKFSGADGGPSIDEALDIDGPNPGLIKEVIIRECFNGDRTVVNSQSIEAIIAANQCASDMVSESRRIAGLTRQTVARQIGGYLGVIKAMSVASGIRHLILLSDGLAIQKEAANLSTVARAAAEAGVQVSVMMEESDINLADPGRRDAGAGVPQQVDVGQAQRRRNDDKIFMDGAQTVADMTGGIFYRVIGTPDPSFDRIAAASSAVYRLGIEPPANVAPGRTFTVVASVKQKPGLTVRTNRQAVAIAPGTAAESRRALPAGPPPDSSKMPPDIQMQVAIQQGKTFSDLPITAAAMVRRSTTAPGQVDVSVHVEVPGSAKGPLNTLFGLVDEKGAIKTGNKVAQAPGPGGNFTLTFLLPVAPGAYTLRFAAADADGKVGSVQTPVAARLATMGAFTTSDLLTWYLDSAGKAQLFAIENVPRGVTTLNASLELYAPEGTTPPDDVNVKWTLVPDGREQPAAEQESTPNAGPGLLRADAAFELQDLPDGLYTLRAAMIVGGAEVGATSTTIRKR
jgi:VWFA-related protein